MAYQRLVRELLDAQRAALIDLRDERRHQRRRPAPDRARARPRGLAAGDLKPVPFDPESANPLSGQGPRVRPPGSSAKMPTPGKPRWEIGSRTGAQPHGELVEKATRRGNYESGSDYVLEYGELRFSFNEQDFAQRVEQAAVKLDFVDQGLERRRAPGPARARRQRRDPRARLAPRRAHQRELGRTWSAPPTAASCTGFAASSSAAPGSTSASRRASSTSSSTSATPDLRLRPAGSRLRADRALREPSWAASPTAR